ncbi:Man1-Src1p-C-terminal domain [Nesidiocoris tenuis]|uniref:Man1-Src1p-C-terminal domain n=1 Tax=Nesidiocoris tenuis TaxID=355587 RepID=A0ABN7AHA2_9HEMI|nr:Man1-Src1p-C-terminal domain [Nesidiocoris tenuis]
MAVTTPFVFVGSTDRIELQVATNQIPLLKKMDHATSERAVGCWMINKSKALRLYVAIPAYDQHTYGRSDGQVMLDVDRMPGQCQSDEFLLPAQSIAMASEVDSWTDHQIREKFEELGCPVGPVTATTRRIMIKKLKALITSGGTPASPARVEEDEEEDDEPDVAPITRIPRRLPRSALAALNATQNGDHSSSQPRRSPRNISEQSTPEREVPEPDFRSRGTRRSSERINGAPDRSPGRSPGRTTRKSVNRETEVRKSSGRERTPPTTENGSPMAVRKLTPGRRNVAQNEQTTSSPAGTQNRMSFGLNGNTNDALGRDNASSTDDLVSRIRRSNRDGDKGPSSIANESFRSYLSSPTVRPDLDSKIPTGSSWRSSLSREDCSLSDDEEAVTSPVKIFRGKKRSEYEVHSLADGKSGLSTLLLVVLIPLSAIVAYLVLSSSSRAGISSSLVYPECGNQLSDVPGLNCLDKSDKILLESMLYAFDRGLDEMRARVPCTTSASRPVLIDNSLAKELITSIDNRIKDLVVGDKLTELKILVKTNPQLDLNPTPDGFALIKGPDTIVCALWARIVTLAEWTIKICVTIFSGVILCFFLRWHFSRQQKLQEELSEAVDKVVGLVKTRRIVPLATLENELHSAGYNNKTATSAIVEAAKDSRISMDTVSNSRALRWTPGVTDTSNNDLPWDRTDKEDIPYFIPPTSCLKLRGMFTPSELKTEDNVKKVVDAILDEAVGNRIVHVVVDSDSSRGVVYLRCLGKADAGGVYRRLNTCKFNGRRVNIKFLREAKYEEKFPESANYTLPLRPCARP